METFSPKFWVSGHRNIYVGIHPVGGKDGAGRHHHGRGGRSHRRRTPALKPNPLDTRPSELVKS